MLQKSILKRTEFSDLPSTPEMTESESKIGPFVRTRDRSIRRYNASFFTRLLGLAIPDDTVFRKRFALRAARLACPRRHEVPFIPGEARVRTGSLLSFIL